MDQLLTILRSENSENVQKILKNCVSPPPVEILLPFVLKKCLQQKKLDRKAIKYAKESFEIFTKLSCLEEEEREKAEYLHRSALILEAVFVLDQVNDYLEAGEEVLKLFREFMEKYKFEKEAKQFNYFAMVCNRRTRFIQYKKESSKMLANLEKRLKIRALPLLEEFIARM